MHSIFVYIFCLFALEVEWNRSLYYYYFSKLVNVGLFVYVCVCVFLFRLLWKHFLCIQNSVYWAIFLMKRNGFVHLSRIPAINKQSFPYADAIIWLDTFIVHCALNWNAFIRFMFRWRFIIPVCMYILHTLHTLHICIL